MKKIVAFCLVLIFLSFYGCTPVMGVVKNVKIEKVSSDMYSEEDINEAIDVVKNYFIKNFNGCRLDTISYAGDEAIKRESQYQSIETNEEVIVLYSDFYVYPDGGDGSLSSDCTYSGFSWILVRTSGGKWEHKDHGY